MRAVPLNLRQAWRRCIRMSHAGFILLPSTTPRARSGPRLTDHGADLLTALARQRMRVGGACRPVGQLE
jgi:hypothetical protein